jgi:hypothetical protein
LLVVSTTGEHAAWFVLDDELTPRPAPVPEVIANAVARIGDVIRERRPRSATLPDGTDFPVA